jgi:tetratricopeptide (TPR) repeat protein
LPRDRNKEVTRLLKRGLNHYGLGDLEAAIEAWERARAIDPENHAVHDYLESAYEERGQDKELDDDLTPVSEVNLPEADVQPARSKATAKKVAGGIEKVVADGLAAYKAGKLDAAWKALQTASAADPDRLDVQGYIQLVGNARAAKWAKEIGDQGRVLRRSCSTEEMMKLKLHPDEGFLLSQIDGNLSISDLISLSTCSKQRTLEVLARLIREEVVA